MILAIGNLYLESNFLGIGTVGKESLVVGYEYSAPKYEVRLGGSAVNFATQVRKLALPIGLLGKIGFDKTGQTILELLNDEGISTGLIRQCEGIQTNIDVGLVFENSAQNIQVVAGNANQSLSIEDIDFYSERFKDIEAVYFGGSFKQKLLWPHYVSLFEKLHQKGIKLFLDPGRVPVDITPYWLEILKDILPLTDAYFPNDTEIMSVTKQKNVKKSLETVSSWGAQLTVVKLGAQGYIISNKGNFERGEAYKVKPVSTVGAGDVFNAAFISNFVKGEELAKCGVFANATAAFRVSMNRQATLSEVKEFINSHK